MAVYKVKVKWGKEVHPDVELDTSETPEVFRAQVFALTGVQPNRQKLLVKGATVKQENWDGVKVKDGSLVLVMGSKEEDVPAEPTTKATFLEDMSEAEINATLELPVGIKNLGNTCYLNAVIQCVKTVPELYEAIKNFDGKGRAVVESSSSFLLTMAIRNCYETMDSGNTPIPLVLVNLFRSTFPRFAEQGEQGAYIQQDASECWTELIHMFQEVLPVNDSHKLNKNFASSVIEQYFNGEMKREWTCVETEGEEVEKSITVDKFHQLSCNINQDVKYLHTGLKARLLGTLTKKSQKLDRDAEFKTVSQITRLPAYLTVDMVRFFYKEKEAVNAKILKDVKFPLTLDVFDFCSPELQKRLSPIRDYYKDMEERELIELRELKKGRQVKSEDRPKLKTIPFSFPDDEGSNNSGFYQLRAVLTHQGRSSSSGHYVAWVHFRNQEWLKCDDDDVTPVTEEEILKLSGGGDWHCAYILLYGPKVLSVPEDTDVNLSLQEVDQKRADTETNETKHTDERMKTP